jgi:hypothetical protein
VISQHNVVAFTAPTVFRAIEKEYDLSGSEIQGALKTGYAAEIFDGLTIPAIGFEQSLQCKLIRLKYSLYLTMNLSKVVSTFRDHCSKLRQSRNDQERANDIHGPRGHRPGRTVTRRMR